MLDTETRLLRAAAQTGAPRIAPERAAAALGADRARVEARLWREHGHARRARRGRCCAGGAEPPLSSAGLTDDQAQAAYGVLTSGRAIDILVGPAGTGKTRTVATARRGLAGGRRRPGDRADHIHERGARRSPPKDSPRATTSRTFLGRIKDSDQTRGHLPVPPGDLLVVDEASMVSTADLAAVEDIATRWGAKILLTGDTEQLSAPRGRRGDAAARR